MRLFSCARWEGHKRLSGVCETFSRSIPTTPRRYRSSPSQMSLRLVILRTKGLYQPRKHLTEPTMGHALHLTQPPGSHTHYVDDVLLRTVRSASTLLLRGRCALCMACQSTWL